MRLLLALVAERVTLGGSGAGRIDRDQTKSLRTKPDALAKLSLDMPSAEEVLGARDAMLRAQHHAAVRLDADL
eukprot:SAG11_NODE_26988_length_338_cov_1.079498_1_plen_73_part_00